MTSLGVALLLEEHRGEIAASWRSAAAALGAEPALGYAIAPLLRELSLALREPDVDPARSGEVFARVAVLIRSGARPAQLAREFKLLHRSIWEALRSSGEPVTPDERLALDGWLHDALAECLERQERARVRLETLDRPAPRGAVRPQPPPLPRTPASPR